MRNLPIFFTIVPNQINLACGLQLQPSPYRTSLKRGVDGDDRGAVLAAGLPMKADAAGTALAGRLLAAVLAWAWRPRLDRDGAKLAYRRRAALQHISRNLKPGFPFVIPFHRNVENGSICIARYAPAEKQ